MNMTDDTKRLLTVYTSLVVFVIGVIIAKYMILGGVLPSTLKPAPALAGYLSPSLANLTSGKSLPVEGSDYKVASVQYFNNRTYAVVSVTALKQSSGDTSVLVIQKLNGSYRVILGPGTAFQKSDILGLPDNVTQYLQTQALVYDTAS